MKKCCHITTVHPPFDVRIFHRECKALADNGYEVALIAPHNTSEIVSGVRIIGLQKSRNMFHRLIFIDLRAFWIAIKEEADVYHFHDPELLFLGLLLKFLTGKKVIYDVHEDYQKQTLSKNYIPKAIRKYIGIAIRASELFVSMFLDGIIVATEDIAGNFSKIKNVVVVKNYPSSRLFNISKEDGRKEDGPINIIYIGGLSEVRGITQIVEAMSIVKFDKPVKLTLCGNFESLNFENKIRKLSGFEKVAYLPWIDYNKIPELLLKHDIGIVCLHPLPNYITALPVKLFEYMACGLPVIASNFPLWKEIIEKNYCGVTVDPLMPDEIAKAIGYLIDHPEERRIMSKNVKNAFLEKYNWENELKVLLNVYGKLIGK